MTTLMFEEWRWTCSVCGRSMESVSLGRLAWAVEAHIQAHADLFVVQVEKFLRWKQETG